MADPKRKAINPKLTLADVLSLIREHQELFRKNEGGWKRKSARTQFGEKVKISLLDDLLTVTRERIRSSKHVVTDFVRIKTTAHSGEVTLWLNDDGSPEEFETPRLEKRALNTKDAWHEKIKTILDHLLPFLKFG